MKTHLWTWGLAATLAGVAAADHPKSYFPLKEGNHWEYTDGFKADVKSALPTPSGVNYWINRLSAFAEPKGAVLRPIRHSVRVTIIDHPPALLYRFKRPAGSTYAVNLQPFPPMTVKVTAKDETVTVPAGTFKKCIRFDFRRPVPLNPGATSLVYSQWFAPGVGLVKQMHSTGAIPGAIAPRLLKRARINWKWIGSTPVDGN